MMRMRTLTLFFMAAGAVPAAFAAEPLDVLISNGTVYDGTGAKPVKADVGIADGKIVFIGAAGSRKATALIDATGLAVAPGFIDPHTHVADAVVQNPQPFTNEQFLTQGVTTIVLGADGGYAPGALRELMSDLKKDGSSTNYACYVGHNDVRDVVMAKAQREPTAAELERMKALVREGMQMGCVGFSTGLMYELSAGGPRILRYRRRVSQGRSRDERRSVVCGERIRHRQPQGHHRFVRREGSVRRDGGAVAGRQAGGRSARSERGRTGHRLQHERQRHDLEGGSFVHGQRSGAFSCDPIA